MNPEHSSSAATESHLYLLGRPPLRDYLSFMSSQPVDAAALDLRELTSKWRQANDLVQALEKSEPDIADDRPKAWSSATSWAASSTSATQSPTRTAGACCIGT